MLGPPRQAHALRPRSLNLFAFAALVILLALPTVAHAKVVEPGPGPARPDWAKDCDVSLAGFTRCALRGSSSRAQRGPAVSRLSDMVQSGTPAPGVLEYSAVVKTGPGVYDRIGLHRVIRARGGRPVRTRNAVMLVHGDAWPFDAAFMGDPRGRHSLPVYLAERGIDVWGVDLGWTLVPEEESDLTFMRDWGLQRDIDDVGVALRLARRVRAATGNGADRLALLGWSRGGWTGYGLLNQEALRPHHQRQVRGFIPVDTFYKTDAAAAREISCADAEYWRQLIADGEYAVDSTFQREVGELAETDPDGESSLFGPPYTNRQASLTYGAALFQFGGTFTPWYHFVAGYFPSNDTDQIPTGLRFTAEQRWNRFLVGAAPLEPARLLADANAVTCDDGSTPQFDANLDEVRLPVLYVGAAGGFGSYGLHTLSLLGSVNVDSVNVRTRPVGEEKLDFAHVDIFHARNADTLVWAHIARWLKRLAH
jgi:hypothetical protein